MSLLIEPMSPGHHCLGQASHDHLIALTASLSRQVRRRMVKDSRQGRCSNCARNFDAMATERRRSSDHRASAGRQTSATLTEERAWPSTVKEPPAQHNAAWGLNM